MTRDLPTRDEFIKRAEAARSRLTRIAWMQTGDEHLAEDVVSDSILRGCDRRQQLRDPEKLEAWLARIVINRCRDIRRSSRETEMKEAEYVSDPYDYSTRLPRLEALEKIMDIILTLEPEEYRDVIILAYYRGMKIDEISRMLDVPPGTVKSRMSRGRAALKVKIDEEGLTRADLEEAGPLEDWPDLLLNP